MKTSPIVIAAAVNHTATIIFLHGLGKDGKSWSSELELIRAPYMKIICPIADTMPVTLYDRAEMPAWFDETGSELDSSGDVEGTEDVRGIKKSAKYIRELVEDEISAGIPSSRIIVGGFSQGGALALYSALTCQHKLAGIVALSCWLPLRKTFSPEKVTVNRNISILQCHGDRDNIVKYEYAELTTSILRTLSNHVDFKCYSDLRHSACIEMMDDVKNFVYSRLPKRV